MKPEMMTESEGEKDASDTQEPQEGEPSGIDQIIATVQSYVDDPKLVTEETLTQLKTDLEDLKTYLDGEEGGESPASAPQGGLMEAMKKKMAQGE